MLLRKYLQRYLQRLVSRPMARGANVRGEVVVAVSGLSRPEPAVSSLPPLRPRDGRQVNSQSDADAAGPASESVARPR